MASPALDAAAKQFAPSSGQANLYVYRNEGYGAAIRLSVNVDGYVFGDTAAQTYLYAPVAPGLHRVVSKAENDSEVLLDVQAGHNYFLWQEIKLGAWTARSELQLVSEARGREGVLQCKLGQTAQVALLPGCADDHDCKGTRICVARQCEYPPGESRAAAPMAVNRAPAPVRAPVVAPRPAEVEGPAAPALPEVGFLPEECGAMPSAVIAAGARIFRAPDPNSESLGTTADSERHCVGAELVGYGMLRQILLFDGTRAYVEERWVAKLIPASPAAH